MRARPISARRRDDQCFRRRDLLLATTISIGQYATATATDSANNTSEFSACKLVARPCRPATRQSNTTATDDNAASDLLDLFLDCGSGKGKFPIALALSSRARAPTMPRRTGRTTTTPRWPARAGKLRPTSTTASARATPPLHRHVTGSRRARRHLLGDPQPGEGEDVPSVLRPSLEGNRSRSGGWRADTALEADQQRQCRDQEGDGTTNDLSPGANGWAPGTYTVELTRDRYGVADDDVDCRASRLSPMPTTTASRRRARTVAWAAATPTPRTPTPTRTPTGSRMSTTRSRAWLRLGRTPRS